jgi:hypothetical protein
MPQPPEGRKTTRQCEGCRTELEVTLEMTINHTIIMVSSKLEHLQTESGLVRQYSVKAMMKVMEGGRTAGASHVVREAGRGCH